MTITTQDQDWGQQNYLKGYWKCLIGSSMTLVTADCADEAREAAADKLGIGGRTEIDWQKARKRGHTASLGLRYRPRRPELIARIVVLPATLEDINTWERIKVEASTAYRHEITTQLKTQRRQTEAKRHD